MQRLQIWGDGSTADRHPVPKEMSKTYFNSTLLLVTHAKQVTKQANALAYMQFFILIRGATILD